MMLNSYKRNQHENARNAKSYMQLQRGADGSWGYVYTASEEAIEQAEQAYEDRQHDLYELQKRQEETLTQQMHSLASQRSSEMRELDQKLANGEIDQEEYDRQRTALESHFQERARYMFEQMGNLFDNNDWANTMYNMGLAMGIDESTLQNILESGDIDQAKELFLAHFGDAQEASDQALQDYQNSITTFLGQHGYTIDNIYEAILGIGAASSENVDDLTKATEELSTEFRQDVQAANIELAKLDEAIQCITERLDPLTERLYNIMNILDGGTGIGTLPTTPHIQTSSDNSMPAGLLGNNSNLNDFYQAWTGMMNPNVSTGQLDYYTEMMRNISASIFASMRGLGEISPIRPILNKDALEQKVQITAQFPGVTSRYEIEEAFNNLINKAAQYANRKNWDSITQGDTYNY